MSASAVIYRVDIDADTDRPVLHAIGEALVQPDGKTLAIHFTRPITLGPDDRLVIRKG